MTVGETRIVEGCRGGGWLRRASLTALALYLAPAALVVLLIGGLGVVCCAVLRLVAGGEPHRTDDGRVRRHGSARTPGVPHVRAASRSRSSSR